MGQRPLMNETLVAPIVVTTCLPGKDVMNDDFRRFFQRHAGDGAPVILPLEKMRPPLECVGDGSAEQGLFPPLIPVIRQPRVEGTIGPFDLAEAEPVETVVRKESDPFARRSVRRGHRELLSVHPRELVVGFAGCHFSAAPAHPLAERPHGPVGQPTEHERAVVGTIVIAEASDDPIGFLNLHTDREGVVAEQFEQGIQVLADRRSTRSHEEPRG